MVSPVIWLPPPLDYSSFTGREADFVEEAYRIFCQDFKTARLHFQGKPVVFNQSITYQNKEEGFWHLISTTSGTTSNRIPDFERCERMPWIRPILENLASQADILMWKNERSNSKQQKKLRTSILLNDRTYPHLIILEEKPSVVALITSYHIRPNSHKHQTRLREYQEYQKQVAAP